LKAEIALMSSNTPTHPPDRKSSFEPLLDYL
jgi:hypothetical protein